MVLETSIEFGPGQSEMINRNALLQYIRNSIEFVKELKRRLSPEKFHEFNKVSADCRAKRIEKTDFVEKVKQILECHKDLLSRLNILLPIEYKIKLPSEDEECQAKKHVKMEDATSFLKKIKAQFEGVDDHTYKSLIKILIMYHMKHKSFTMVCQEVTTLLQGHPDLLDEFHHFLPKTTSAQYVAARKSVLGDK